MLKQESSTLCFKGSTTRAVARVCDTCRSALSAVFCRADFLYLCSSCDTSIHAASELQHERVRVCEACKQAPSAFICKADAASLCAVCDADVHVANPLAQRHQRVPVVPLGGFLSEDNEDEDDNESASWLVFDDLSNGQIGNKNGFLIHGEGGGDEYLDFVGYNSCQDTQLCDDRKTSDERCYTVAEKVYGGGDADSVVPIRVEEAQNRHQFRHWNFENGKLLSEMEYETSKSSSGYGFPASLGHTVSMSSLDVGIVPNFTITEEPFTNGKNPKGETNLFSDPQVQMPTQPTPMDREARVLRYREKKKTRKFEKTIRYASRKAYAESRPRIKGRFAKRRNADVEVDQMFSTTLMTEGGYCIVPSF